MGGYGSGWNRSRRATVEESLTLELAWLRRNNLFVPGECRSGVVRWSIGEHERASIRCATDLRPEVRPTLFLRYQVGRGDVARELEYVVLLEATTLVSGGARWWFRCPLEVDAHMCGRRVAKIHSPPGQDCFGCRHCYNLTYESCNESHKYDGLFASIGADMGLSSRAVGGLVSMMRRKR